MIEAIMIFLGGMAFAGLLFLLYCSFKAAQASREEKRRWEEIKRELDEFEKERYGRVN